MLDESWSRKRIGMLVAEELGCSSRKRIRMHGLSSESLGSPVQLSQCSVSWLYIASKHHPRSQSRTEEYFEDPFVERTVIDTG